MVDLNTKYVIEELLFEDVDIPNYYNDETENNEEVEQYLYAIVNGAGTDKVLMNLVAYEPEHRILFNDSDAETLEDAAPWLVRLSQGESYTEWLFEECLEKRLLLFLKSSENIDQLAQHFKYYTKTEFPNKNDPENYKMGFFSFYDPSIFPTWAESLNQEEARQFFLPLNTIWYEEDSQLKLLYLQGSGWKQREFDLEKADDEDSKNINKATNKHMGVSY